MSVQAIIVQRGASPTMEFRPTGTDEWELALITARGPEPGGHWPSEEVAKAVVDAIYGDDG